MKLLRRCVNPDSSCFPTHRPTSGHVNAIFWLSPSFTWWVKRRSLGQTGLSDAIIPGQRPYLRLRSIPTSLVHEELGLTGGSDRSHSQSPARRFVPNPRVIAVSSEALAPAVSLGEHPSAHVLGGPLLANAAVLWLGCGDVLDTGRINNPPRRPCTLSWRHVPASSEGAVPARPSPAQAPGTARPRPQSFVDS